ncbi:hypothetical protein Q5692_35720 [Microcoleus sp. C2C3]|uniref:hypothetical protein n=1 Tax=unclassified Microcoleus TaxID=2642155 RepID=UPI002FD280D0
MSVVVDNLGGWFDLGTISPNHEWKLTNNGAALNALFRLTYTTDWTEWETTTKFKSYGLIRFHYRQNEQFSLVDRAVKIYPKREIELVRFPPPPEFSNLSNIVRVPAVKRVTYDRRGQGGLNLANIILWSVKIEYLLIT